jgi:hypothetical protein
LAGCSAFIGLDGVNPDDDGGSGGQGGDDGGRAGTGSGGDVGSSSGGVNTGSGGDTGGMGGQGEGGTTSSGGTGNGGVGGACSPNPCQNDGTCTLGDAEDSFICNCSPEFAGDTCEDNGVRSCLEWLRLGETEDGVQEIDPDGAGPAEPLDVYCDMTTSGGGWTLISSQTDNAGYTDDWGTTGVNLEEPSPSSRYVLDFIDKLPDPGYVMMRFESGSNSAFFVRPTLRDPFRDDTSWVEQVGSTGLKRRVVKGIEEGEGPIPGAENWYLVFTDGMRDATEGPDFYCVGPNNPDPGILVPGAGGAGGAGNEVPQGGDFLCDGLAHDAVSTHGIGQGLFNGDSPLVYTDCTNGDAVWKHSRTGIVRDTCNPAGQITIWFREPVQSCAELRDFQPDANDIPDGAYTIDPDGIDGEEEPFNVYCDMTTEADGKVGGWTLVAVNGTDGTPAAPIQVVRPTVWRGNSYPRPGASFYGGATPGDMERSIEQALIDVWSIRAGASVAFNYSIAAKTLYENSDREILIFVGGSTVDHIYAQLPQGCNYFDGAGTCGENGELFTVFDSNGVPVTTEAQACTTAHRMLGFESDPFDEFGLTLLDGDDDAEDRHCFEGSSQVGFEDAGNLYVTRYGSPGSAEAAGNWSRGVISHWNDGGTIDQPGFIMIR